MSSAPSSDDLLGRDAINAVRPDTHEIGAAAGDNVGLESVRSQVTQQLLHRLISELVVGLAETRVFGRGEPRLDLSVEVIGRHPSMGERNDLQQAIVMFTFEEFGKVARKGRLHHGVRRELRIARGAAL